MSLVDSYQAYLTAGTTFTRLLPTGTGRQMVYALFNQGSYQLLPFVDTGVMYPGDGTQMGDPSTLREFDTIRFGGAGTLFLNVWVDDTLILQGAKVVLAEDPYQASTLSLPSGTAGFGIRLQIAGLAWIRWFKINWEPLGGEN